MENHNAQSKKYAFTLFISGMSPKSSHALENIKQICDTYCADNYDLKIIDISTEKEKAVEYQIVGIPTLIKTAPDPQRIILGDLSDTQKVLKILDIQY